MPRKVFLSFHCDNDISRVQQIKNIAAIECQTLFNANDWESVRRQGDAAIQKWIDTGLVGRVCTIVCIGSQTAGRHWVNHEIVKSWNEGKGIFGIHIHKLKDKRGLQSGQGANPFSFAKLPIPSAAELLLAHNPPFHESDACLRYIAVNIERWIDEAVALRAQYPEGQ